MPWKNGGGTTREIAVFPPGTGMEDFLWRLSMAQVEATGPFSAFAGIDRTLAVIEGRLALNGPDLDVTLDSTSAPLPFDACLPVEGRPLDGPVLDLNAMVRRETYAVSMTRLAAGDAVENAGTCFLIALKAQRCGDVWLDALDCLQVTRATKPEGPVLFVTFTDASD